jgi:hypothetical protein
MADSCYGRHLSSMISIMKGIVKEFSESRKVLPVIWVEGFPFTEDSGVYRDLVRRSGNT